MDEVDLISSARLPSSGAAAVPAVLRILRTTCLPRALVLQAWRADHGEPLDVVIGVTAPSAGFTAHAWLDDPRRAGDATGFQALHRVAPPARRAAGPLSVRWDPRRRRRIPGRSTGRSSAWPKSE